MHCKYCFYRDSWVCEAMCEKQDNYTSFKLNWDVLIDSEKKAVLAALENKKEE